MKDTDQPNFLQQKYTSPDGVELEIVKIANTSLYGIQIARGGRTPKECEGMFTSSKNCKEAIEKYFKRVEKELSEINTTIESPKPKTKVVN